MANVEFVDAGKVEIIPGPDEHAATFIIRDEDHTLGNALRYVIMKNPDVEFCGYSMPHPSEAKVNIRIQTYSDSMTASAALMKGLDDLGDLCDHVLATFDKELIDGQYEGERPVLAEEATMEE